MYGYTLASEHTPGQLNFTFQQMSTALSDPTQGDRWFAVTASPAFPNATRFLGDYSGIASVPGQRVAAFWTDMRNTVTFGTTTGSGQDAYFALVKAVPGDAPQDAEPAGSSLAAAVTSASGSRDHVDEVFAGLAGPLPTATAVGPTAPSGNGDAVPALVYPSTSADFTLDAILLDLEAQHGGLKRYWNRLAGQVFSPTE
jgi:hypothetical protein